MTETATSKIQTTTNPALPATCVVCSKAAVENTLFYDWGVNLDWYGAIVMCEDCAHELVEIIQSKRIAFLEAKNVELQAALGESKTELAGLQNALDTLLNLRPSVRDNHPGLFDLDNSDDEEGDGLFAAGEDGLIESATE